MKDIANYFDQNISKEMYHNTICGWLKTWKLCWLAFTHEESNWNTISAPMQHHGKYLCFLSNFEKRLLRWPTPSHYNLRIGICSFHQKKDRWVEKALDKFLYKLICKLWHHEPAKNMRSLQQHKTLQNLM